MCLCIVDGVYPGSGRQNLVILILKSSGTSFLALRNTGIHKQAVNCLHLLYK